MFLALTATLMATQTRADIAGLAAGCVIALWLLGTKRTRIWAFAGLALLLVRCDVVDPTHPEVGLGQPGRFRDTFPGVDVGGRNAPDPAASLVRSWHGYDLQSLAGVEHPRLLAVSRDLSLPLRLHSDRRRTRPAHPGSVAMVRGGVPRLPVSPAAADPRAQPLCDRRSGRRARRLLSAIWFPPWCSIVWATIRW